MNDYGAIVEPGTFRIERLLPGPIERVWSYLADSEKRARWLASGEIELRVGGRATFEFDNMAFSPGDPPPPKYAQQAISRVEGRVTACDPPTLLSFTWDETPDRNSEVRFELATQGNKVRLVVTHRRLDTRDNLIAAAGGWHAHLSILLDRLEGRVAAGFWSLHTRLEREYESLLAGQG